MREPWDDGDDGFPADAVKVRPIRPQLQPTKRAGIDWAPLAGLEPPARKWADKGWFGFGHTTLLIGQGGIGKTLLSQQWASCLALGRGYVDEAPEPQKVLMWACEDDHDELWRRQVAIAQWLQVGIEAFSPNLVIVPRHGLENALVSTEYGKLMFSTLLDELREQALDIGALVVILDNIAQLYGGNENDRHAVTVFLNALAGALPGRALLLLGHPSRGQGSEFSGSSAWENTARTRLYLGSKLPGEKQDEEPGDDHVRYLARRKSNYSSRDWRKLNYMNGVLIPELAEHGGGMVEHIRGAQAERVLLDGMQVLAGRGVRMARGNKSPDYLPKLLVDYNLASGVKITELASAMRRLFIADVIRSAVVGKNPKNRNPVEGLEITPKG